LARANADRLREQVDSDRFVARFDFPITAQTIGMFQGLLPFLLSPMDPAGNKYAGRFLDI